MSDAPPPPPPPRRDWVYHWDIEVYGPSWLRRRFKAVASLARITSGAASIEGHGRPMAKLSAVGETEEQARAKAELACDTYVQRKRAREWRTAERAKRNSYTTSGAEHPDGWADSHPSRWTYP